MDANAFLARLKKGGPKTTDQAAEEFAFAENLLHQRDDAVSRATAAETALAAAGQQHADELAGLRAAHAGELGRRDQSAAQARGDADAFKARLAEAQALIDAMGGTEAGKKVMAQKRVGDLEKELAAVTEARDKAKAEAGG